MEKIDLSSLTDDENFREVGEIKVDNKLVKGISVENREEEIERETKKFIDFLEKFINQFAKEMEETRKIIHESLSEKFPENKVKNIKTEIENASETIREKPELLENLLTQKEVFQTLLDISDDTLFSIYEVGFDLFEKGKFEMAKNVFVYTTMLNPTIYDFWIALGSTESQLQHIESELLFYAFASILDWERPESHYYSALAYLRRGDIEDAELEALELEKVVDRAKVKSEWQDLTKKLKEIIQANRG